MKKAYVKPQIAFESFQLTSNIAGDCNQKPNTQANEATCGYNDNGWIIFHNEFICDILIDSAGTGAYNRFCYHVPTSDISVFAS